MNGDAYPAPDTRPTPKTLEQLRQDLVDALLDGGPQQSTGESHRHGSLHIWSYQELLQAVGATLDEDNAGRIGIVEVDDGFLLRRQRFRHTVTDLGFSHVQRKTLRQYAETIRLGPPRRGGGHRPGIWSSFPFTHQDFFQALGRELDSAGAHSIVIDELTEGLFLSYSLPGRSGVDAVRRTLILDRREIEEIFNETVGRGHPRAGMSVVPSGHAAVSAPGPPAYPLNTAWSLPRSGRPYRRILQEMGRALDRSGAEQICLLEAPDGMVVRYRRPGDEELTWARFTDEQIVEGAVLRKKRESLLRRKRRASAGFGELLRALGYELERAYASCVLLLEQDGGLTVTCQYLDPHQSLTPQRAAFFLGEKQQEEIRHYARGRHQQETSYLTRLTHRPARASTRERPRHRRTAG